jgi:arylsulfatase I/J
MATPDHTPRGRGYQESMSYFHHCNDYWSMVDGMACEAGTVPHRRKVPVVDLWRGARSYEGPAHGYNNSCTVKEPAGGHPIDCVPGPMGDTWHEGYEDSLLEQRVLRTIGAHDAATPLFLFWAPHIVHTPLQLPDAYMAKFDFMAPTDKPGHERQRYLAMVHFADAMVGNVTAALKAKGMWDDLLVVFSTDNGGPIYGNGSAGANNFPLKGGKMNNWEGGIRGNAFVSGGFVPAALRGSRYEGLVTLWDWYATFAALAGVDATDHRAAAAQLPPIDSYDMSAVLLGRNLTSPRSEIPIGTEPRASNLSGAPLCISYDASPYYEDPRVLGDEIAAPPLLGRCTTLSGVIVDEGEAGLWKLLTGTVEQAVYTGPHYPNASSSINSMLYASHCAAGCLYNLRDDPLEQVDLAAQMPAKADALRAKVVAYGRSAFNPRRGKTNPAACRKALGPYGGFWGPFVA